MAVFNGFLILLVTLPHFYRTYDELEYHRNCLFLSPNELAELGRRARIDISIEITIIELSNALLDSNFKFRYEKGFTFNQYPFALLRVEEGKVLHAKGKGEGTMFPMTVQKTNQAMGKSKKLKKNLKNKKKNF